MPDATTRRRALITGAASGTGAACALALAPTHDVVLVGRRRGRLEDVAEQARERGATAQVVEADVTRRDGADLLAEAGRVDDLVLAAGLNARRRTWADQTTDEFRAIIDTNLVSVADLVGAALPSMRERGGTISIISSLSAWMTSPGAGVAYRASKMALRALTDALNEQEAVHGVRAGLIMPGDIDTEFLEHRPAPPGAQPRMSMLAAEDVAAAVVFALTAPAHVRIDELVITPLGSVQR